MNNTGKQLDTEKRLEDHIVYKCIDTGNLLRRDFSASLLKQQLQRVFRKTENALKNKNESKSDKKVRLCNNLGKFQKRLTIRNKILVDYMLIQMLFKQSKVKSNCNSPWVNLAFTAR